MRFSTAVTVRFNSGDRASSSFLGENPYAASTATSMPAWAFFSPFLPDRFNIPGRNQ